MTATSDDAKKRGNRASARIDVRLTPEQKAIIQRAADLQSRSISDFVIDTAYEAAEHAIRQQAMISLSIEESKRFAEVLLHPPAPGERLRAAARRYRQFVDE